MKNINKTTKTILFASLIAAMILPFSTMDFAEAKQVDNKNPKDKTLERIQEKTVREEVLKKIKELDTENEDLKNKVKSETNQGEIQRINKRISEIKSEMEQMEQDNHKKDIPEAQLNKLINQQESFEQKLLNSDVAEFVTSIGIDITSKEIQIGLDQYSVNSENIDSVVSILEELMPKNAQWHVVYSNRAQPLACTQTECTPIIGGNLIHISTKYCSYGFQAKKGSTWGWITAGHCADGKVGYTVTDASNDNIGTVNSENFYWGTSCDCAWITSSSSIVDNKVYYPGTQYTITKTTQASQQQNVNIMKSGAYGGIDFGTVSAINVTVLDVVNNYYVKNLVRSNTLMDHGDSGGTIVENSDRGDLYGIVAADDWWGYYHTPIDLITASMGVTPVLN